MGESLDLDLLSIQSLPDKLQVMPKLCTGDSPYRSYVEEGKRKFMHLGRMEYYYPQDLAKSLLATKGRRRKRTEYDRYAADSALLERNC